MQHVYSCNNSPAHKLHFSQDRTDYVLTHGDRIQSATNIEIHEATINSVGNCPNLDCMNYLVVVRCIINKTHSTCHLELLTTQINVCCCLIFANARANILRHQTTRPLD
jgi:hypothetical protein